MYCWEFLANFQIGELRVTIFLQTATHFVIPATFPNKTASYQTPTVPKMTTEYILVFLNFVETNNAV